EFVGEMAHINQEPRSASVKALEDCELIEIPNGSLDLVLFSKPAWAQALMRTLSRRLKRINETLAKTSQK
ncbi:MAG: Crp/Fnr family transcriptional regulator, partial [Bdellovibrionaceae bacterium]|nr:Crp/Fnr family transcriptional regulator [Pseudobdellovibrionaceae bacterium]